METWKEIMTNGPLATFSETGCGETLEDSPCLRLMLDTTAPGGDKVLCAVWLDAEGLFPRYAEVSRNEQGVLTVKLLAFTCTTSEG